MAQKEPKTYAPNFEFQLVLEVLKDGRSEVELGRGYSVHHHLQMEASLSFRTGFKELLYDGGLIRRHT
jgi:hypothetical protein